MDLIVVPKSSAVQQVFISRQVFFNQQKKCINGLLCIEIAANFDEKTVEKLPPTIYQSVYYGWAKLLTTNHNEVYKMVTSVGTNPFYHGEKKTMV
jgi:hypothetical protein